MVEIYVYTYTHYTLSSSYPTPSGSLPHFHMRYLDIYLFLPEWGNYLITYHILNKWYYRLTFIKWWRPFIIIQSIGFWDLLMILLFWFIQPWEVDIITRIICCSNRLLIYSISSHRLVSYLCRPSSLACEWWWLLPVWWYYPFPLSISSIHLILILFVYVYILLSFLFDILLQERYLSYLPSYLISKCNWPMIGKLAEV